MKEGSPTIPLNAPNAQLVTLGATLSAGGAGVVVWCPDYAGGATLIRWSGTAWSPVGAGSGGGATGRIVTVTLPIALDGAQSIDFTDAIVSVTSIIIATFYANVDSENDPEDISGIALVAVAGAGKVTFNFDAQFAYGGAFSIQYLIGASL